MNTGHTGPLDQFCEPETEMAYFHIYRNGFLRSTIDAICSNYPATQSLLGAETFRALARQFVLQFPPTSGSLTGYGNEFPAFLKAAKIGRRLSYLYDIAMIDQAWLKVYFASDDIVLTPEQVTTILGSATEAESQQIELCAPTEIVSLNFPVLSVWQELKERGSVKQRINLEAGAEHVLIWRKQAQIFVRQLPAAETAFLASLKEGRDLESAAQSALDKDANFELGIFFATLISESLLTTRHNLG